MRRFYDKNKDKIFVTYDDIKIIGKFKDYRFHKPIPETGVLGGSYSLDMGNGFELSFSYSNEPKEQVLEHEVLDDTQINPQDMRKNTEGKCAVYYYKDIRYVFEKSAGHLLAVQFVKNGIRYSIGYIGSENKFSDYPNDPDSFLFKFFNLETVEEAISQLPDFN